MSNRDKSQTLNRRAIRAAKALPVAQMTKSGRVSLQRLTSVPTARLNVTHGAIVSAPLHIRSTHI